MADIYGRSVSRFQPGVTISTVKKIIRDGIEKLTKRIRDIVRTEIAETLNIAEVDPGEIVVFENANGKIKTSNMHLTDILTRQRNVAEGTMALYSGDGLLKPGALVSTITDKLAAYDKEFDDHMKNYNNFRRNIVNRFFGSPISVLPSLAEIKTSIDEIAAIKKSVSDLNIQQLQKSVNDGKAAIESINAELPKFEKIKISHSVENIISIVYTVRYEILDWIKDTNNKINFIPTVSGIYRFTIIDFNNQFDINEEIVSRHEGPIQITISENSTKNTTMNKIDINYMWTITVLSSAKNIMRKQIPWTIEFIMATKRHLEILTI